jgi:mannose-6-phosphate isomerase
MQCHVLSLLQDNGEDKIMNSIFHLKGTIKHYDWGGFSFIPQLLQIDNPEHQPFAEYWLGVHPQDHCVIDLSGRPVLLKEFISENRSLLGNEVKNRFGHLPYLLKILDVRRMLSIQVHPSKPDAEKEFARENAERIPIDAINRNYKDDNHKPELMVAMSDFWLLHGFKEPEALHTILHSKPEFAPLSKKFTEGSYADLYRWVMTMPQDEVNRILQPLLNRLIPQFDNGKLEKNNEDYWAAQAALNFPHHGRIDRGIFSIYLFNLLCLKEGQGIYQEAGVPHAYLEGQNVEIMASSDNVLRGGLTNKYVDVKELLKHINPEPTSVELVKMRRVGEHEMLFLTPVPDFSLSVINMEGSEVASFSPVTAEILLVTNGSVKIDNGINKIKLERGHPAAIVFPGTRLTINATGPATIFRASVPVVQVE